MKKTKEEIYLDGLVEILNKNKKVRLKVYGGSMTPFIKDKDVITVRKVKPEEIKIGQVVLYKAHNKFLVHRIIKKQNGNSFQFIVKGDSMDNVKHSITEEQILGVVKENYIKRILALVFCQYKKLITAGILIFTLAMVSFSSGFLGFRQDSYEDFSTGTLSNSDITSSSGLVKLSKIEKITAVSCVLPKAVSTASAVWDPVRKVAYIFGGEDADGTSDAIVKFNPAANTAVTLSVKLPAARSGTSAVWDNTNNVAYVFGGWSGTVELNTIVKFDPSTGVDGTASNLGVSLPSPMQLTSAVWDSSNTVAYVFGGHHDSTYLSTVVRFNPAGTTENLSATLPTTGGITGRRYTSAVWDSSNKVAYIFGGYGSNGSYLDDILRFDPAEGQVEVLAVRLPNTRQAASSVWDSEKNVAYIYGGINISSTMQSIVKFDPSAGVASIISNAFVSPRQDTCAVWDSTNKCSYIFGGYYTEQINEIVKFYWGYNSSGTFISLVKNKNDDTSGDLKNIMWTPSSQSAGTEIKFQLATSKNAGGPWIYKGPDGTTGSFYTNSYGESIYSGHAGDNYFRYKAYLSSSDDALSSNLDEIIITYTSSSVVNITGQLAGTKIKSTDTIAISGNLPVLSGKSYSLQACVKDQNENQLTKGISASSISLSSDGTLSGNVSLQNIRVYYPLVTAIKVEINAEETVSKQSIKASSSLIHLEFTENSFEIYNNKFNPNKSEKMSLKYEIIQGGNVSIKIYALNGELLAALTSENKDAGAYTLEWDGKNDAGSIVASGIYLIHVDAPGLSSTKKIAIIK